MNKLNLSSTREAGSLVFVSGQVGHINGKIVEGGVIAETQQAFQNVKNELTKSGLTLANLIDVQIFLTDLGQDYSAMNEVYNNLVSEPYPTRTCVGVTELPLGAHIEIKAVATQTV